MDTVYTMHQCRATRTYLGLGRLSLGLLSPNRLLIGDDLLFGGESGYMIIKSKSGRCMYLEASM